MVVFFAGTFGLDMGIFWCDTFCADYVPRSVLAVSLYSKFPASSLQFGAPTSPRSQT